MGKSRKILALLLAASMIVPSLPAQVQAEEAGAIQEKESQVAVPAPYYEFTFDQGVQDNRVENEGTKTGVYAMIEGNQEGLGVIEDEARGNKVLNLPGGTVSGEKDGRLTLPDDMFAEVGEDGFAFSFWINIDPSASQYSRIFSATVNGQNSDEGWPWEAPEFAFVAGDENASDLGDGQSGYHTCILLPDKSQLRLVWEQQFAKGRWQHVTISVSPTSYDVYLDGKSVNMLYDRNDNQAAVLNSLFADNGAVLKQYRFSGIGPSVYKTDKDLKAKMDEFRFYNTALTSEQAKAAYDSYAVRDTVIQGLRDKVAEAEAKSISFYTKDSYAALAAAVTQGKAGIENPVTEANVTNLINKLDAAIQGLVFYQGVTADTEFSSAQLVAEHAQAEKILEQGGLTAESEQDIQDAVDAAESALAGKDQDAVDTALMALRKAVDAKSYGAMLHFNVSPEEGKELLHGSTGFLYGVSEIGVPSADLIKAIAPKILVQKAADGQQHPSGDGYRLTSYLSECGVENIQIYLQDYYLQWPYESNGIDDYNEKVQAIVTRMVKGKTAEELSHYSFVIFNEPDGIWYGNDVTKLCNDWLKIYTTIKGINPDLKVAGPNYSVYNSSAYRTFFDFCQKNDCLPEYITWHELQKDKLVSFKSHADEVKGFVKTYYADSDIQPVLFVNETVNFDDVGNPGALVNWLSVFEEEDVYASLPYWGLANSLNELAADANKPNGAWWVYKWYAQMTGKKAPLTLENIEGPGPFARLYGLTSTDEEAGVIYSLFGGQAGKQTVSIENIRSTKMFQNADKAHVTLYSTKFTGQQGFADDIPVEFEGNLRFAGDDLVLSVSGAELMDAYFAVITPASGEDTSTIAGYEKNWEQTYEAEDAELIGGAKAYTKTGGGDLARSNRAEVGSLDTEEDGVKFTVDVPRDGRYRLNIYYTSQAPQVDPLTLQYVPSNGQNRAIGALSSHNLTIDGGRPQEIIYDSTVKWGYYNYKTVYVELTKGQHEIQLMYKGESQKGKDVNSILCAMLDKIDLTYEPAEEAVVCIEPEELAASQNGYALSQEGSFSGAGSAVGSGNFEFYVNVPRDGYYKVGTAGTGTAELSRSKVNYAKDAKAESTVSLSWQKLLDVTLGNENAGMIYLTAGVNGMCLKGTNLTIDQVVFTEVPEATAGNSIVMEAEDYQLSGTDEEDGYNYLPGGKAVPKIIETKYASGGKAVEGFRGGKDNALTLNVTVAQAGDYKLSVFYANNEPAPVMKTQDGKDYVHPYNTDLVERYMQISVNEEIPQTVYFKNTFCWDTYNNTIVDVKLKKGRNIIRLSNDNSYKFSSVQDDFTPRMDKFIIAPASADSMKLPEPEITEAEIPIITKQPENAFYQYGQEQPANALTVEARVSDQGTLSYQWYKNDKNSTEGAVRIAGADKASYTPDITSIGTCYYYCVVTNTNDKVTGSKTAEQVSSMALVRVAGVREQAAVPVIKTQPQHASYAYGEEAKALTVEAETEDGGTLSYQWYKNTSNSTEGAELIKGAVKASYTPSTLSKGTLYYYCMVTNTNPAATVIKTAEQASSLAMVRVREAGSQEVDAAFPTITKQPQSASYRVGEDAKTLTVEAETEDGGTLSYQWYKNTSNSTEGAEPIKEAVEASYTPETDTEGIFYYYCIVTNTNQAATGLKTAEQASSLAEIKVEAGSAGKVDAAAPSITRQPAEGSYTLGQKAQALTIEAKVSDQGTLSYQWYKNTSNSTEGAELIKGAAEASYTPSTAAAGTTYYYCVVTNTNESVTGKKIAEQASSLAAVTVAKAAGKITGVSSRIKKVYGAKAFTLKAEGQGTLTYTSSDKKVVTVGSKNGKVSIKGCGKATITVIAAGNSNYKPATMKIAVTVAPKQQKISSLKSVKSKSFTLKWKKDKKASGYQIQYALNKNFKKAKLVSVKKYKTTRTMVKKLKAKKRYYVRVRSYKISGKTKVLGAWSKTKKVVIKK